MEHPEHDTKKQYPPEIYRGLPTREEIDRIGKIVVIVLTIYLIVSTGLIIAQTVLLAIQGRL